MARFELASSPAPKAGGVTGLPNISKYMYLVLTPTPLAMLSSCHQVTIGLQIISRLEWIHQVTTSTFCGPCGNRTHHSLLAREKRQALVHDSPN